MLWQENRVILKVINMRIFSLFYIGRVIFTLLSMINFKKKLACFKNPKGFTLVELLVVIAIIGLLSTFAGIAFSNARVSARDTLRASNISTIKRALVMYLNDSQTGYPVSNGECLSSASNVGSELIASEVLMVAFPVDPLWPTTAPAHTNGVPNAGQTNFCYFYFSDSNNEFKLSYYLEASSSAGPAGINTVTE